MTERPILFSASMVRALRHNCKSQTRRTTGLKKINAEPNEWELEGEMPSHSGVFRWKGKSKIGLSENHGIRCPYGIGGDQLWTRESWRVLADYNFRKPRELCGDWIEFFYEADGPLTSHIMMGEPGRLRPGIFLPRWASRDNLKLVGVRPERLQAITENDAIAEGCRADEDPFWKPTYSDPDSGGYPSGRNSFEYRWHEIHGAKSWMENPWVWRIEFSRLTS